MSDKVNQHTVPQFYLRHFTPDDGDKILWQYSKLDPDRPLRKSPRAVAAEDYFYSHQKTDGSWNHSLEELLSKIETMTAPAYRRLLNNEPLQRGDRQVVAQFIGLMFMRTKGPRDAASAHASLFESPEFASDYARLNQDELIALYGEDKVQEFLAGLESNGQGLVLPKNFHLQNVFERADRWGERIIRMAWTIYTTKAPNFFITSDNPAFARNPCQVLAPAIVGIDRDDLNVELGFPLSSKSFLIARWGTSKGPFLSYEIAKKARVHALNMRTVLSSTDCIFAPNKSRRIEELVNQYRHFRLQFPKYSHRELLMITRERKRNG